MSRMITRSRAFSTQALKVVNNATRQQFVVTLQNEAEATLSYDKKDSQIIFISTDVPKEFQGRGVGKILAQYAFSYATDNNLNVICRCNFLSKYYENNLNKYKNLKVKIELE